MRLPMVDCRNLIEFCQAFDQQNHSNNHSRNKNSFNSNSNSNANTTINPKYHPFCERSPFAVVDIIMQILVLGALGFLIYHESVQILPLVIKIITDTISDPPIAYVIGLIAAFSGVIVSIAAWEILELKSRRCGKPECKGLHKSIEFDVQLESEECIKYSPLKGTGGYGVTPLEVGEDHKELEAELKKTAPVNGRTVVIFRASCGCPAGRLEVWGQKRIRRIKL